MLKKIGEITQKCAVHLIPDAFIFAIILSVVCYLMGIWLTPSGPLDMIYHWYDGFWNFLGFSMQMVFILLTGYVLAQSPLARRCMTRMAKAPKTAGQGMLLIAFTTLIAGFINWGLGLVVGAVMSITVARDLKARGIKLHFPLAAAAGYLGLSIHSSGFSSTAPLISNTNDHFLFDMIGVIPFAETVLQPYNLIASAIYIIVIPFVMKAMHPADKDVQEIHLKDEIEETKETGFDEGEVLGYVDGKVPLAQRLENSVLLMLLVVIPGAIYVGYFFATRGFDLNINIINFIFLIVGMFLYKTPGAYVKAMGKAAGSASGIILQFPFYAGILGMMSLSGLIEVLANGMIAMSTQFTFPFLAFISAAIVNLFVPSAGGQWAVQGPILLEAGKALEVPIGVTIMAHQYGDQVTNMIQPFWALPLLGLTGLKAKDVLGYTVIVMFVGMIIWGGTMAMTMYLL